MDSVLFIILCCIGSAFTYDYVRSQSTLINHQLETIEKIRLYTDWLLDSAPFFLAERQLFENKTYSDRNGIQCLEMTFDIPSESKYIFQDYFLRNIHDRYGMSIRFRKTAEIGYEPFYCNYFIAIHMNSLTLFDDIRFFGTIKKSQYFVIIIPQEILKDEITAPEELMDIKKWPVDVFTHTYVAVIINRRIYRLSHPYSPEERSFSRINETIFKTWNWVVRSKAKRTLDFYGKHLKVAAINCPPLFIWDHKLRPNKTNYPSSGDIETVCKDDKFDAENCTRPDGIGAHYLNILSNKLNFTWSYYYPKTGEYGVQKKDGSADGILGEIMHADGDFVMCNVFVSYNRLYTIDFGVNYIPAITTFLVPRPNRSPSKWYSMFQGLSQPVWEVMAFILIFILLSLILCRILYQTILKAKINLNARIQYIFIELISVGINGNTITQYNIPGFQFILTCWSFYGLFMGLMYSCNLVTFLTFPQYEKALNTPQDFLNSNLNWTLSFKLDMSTHFYEEFIPKLKQKLNIIQPEFSEFVLENIAQKKEAVFVVLQDTAPVPIALPVKEIPKNILLELKLMRTYFFSGTLAPVYRKNSPFKQDFEYYIMRLIDFGIFEHITNTEIDKLYSSDWYSVRLEHLQVKQAAYELTMLEMYGVFIILLAGLIISFIIFAIEILINIIYLTYVDRRDVDLLS